MIVAVLAGGRGRRLRGAKPVASFAGGPLITRPLAAAAAAGLPAMVVAKPATPLRATLEAFGAAAFELDDPRLVASINTFEELVAAERT